MKKQVKQLTNENLISMLNLEIEKNGKYVYTDKRKTIEEMLKMRGIKL